MKIGADICVDCGQDLDPLDTSHDCAKVIKTLATYTPGADGPVIEENN